MASTAFPDHLPSDDGEVDGDLRELVGGRLPGVLTEDDQIGELARLEGSAVVHMAGEGCIRREGADRRVEVDPLVRLNDAARAGPMGDRAPYTVERVCRLRLRAGRVAVTGHSESHGMEGPKRRTSLVGRRVP